VTAQSLFGDAVTVEAPMSGVIQQTEQKLNRNIKKIQRDPKVSPVRSTWDIPQVSGDACPNIQCETLPYNQCKRPHYNQRWSQGVYLEKVSPHGLKTPVHPCIFPLYIQLYRRKVTSHSEAHHEPSPETSLWLTDSIWI